MVKTLEYRAISLWKFWQFKVTSIR